MSIKEKDGVIFRDYIIRTNVLITDSFVYGTIVLGFGFAFFCILNLPFGANPLKVTILSATSIYIGYIMYSYRDCIRTFLKKHPFEMVGTLIVAFVLFNIFNMFFN